MPTVLAALRQGQRRLARAKLHYGHGTVSAADDAAALLCHVLELEPPMSDAALRRRLSGAAYARYRALLQRRVRERMPAVYLTGRTWFAGYEFRIDGRVLIPRSPLAELIEQQFAPWIQPQRVRRICDVGTGSGCIAVACAHYFPKARVDALDISLAALTVARLNIRRHRLQGRIRALRSDHFQALGRVRYDIIVSNPPYVGARELAKLPAEYTHEPRLALAAGRTGLDSVTVLLRQASRYLRAGGILVVEVGNSEVALRRRYRRLPFLWLQFARGGGGVFVLTREQLQAADIH
jgi:ribosomal protein L3 glutamine methyltransferase